MITLLMLVPLVSGMSYTTSPSVQILPRACNTEFNTEGTCMRHDDCLSQAGTPEGRCAQNLATCCSFRNMCGRTLTHNQTILVNTSCPLDDKPMKTGHVIVDKLRNLCAVTLDMEELTGVRQDKKCHKDWYQVNTELRAKNSVYGRLNNDHVSVDLGKGSSDPVVLSMITSNRKWKLKLNMVPCS